MSSAGNIRSLNRVIRNKNGQLHRIKGQMMGLHKNDAGYVYTVASRSNQWKRIWAHRAVLEAFVSLRPKGKVCMHMNNNPADNRIENLRWGTQRENLHQMVAEGRQANMRKTHCPRFHPLEAPNLVPHILKEGRRACLACYEATRKFPLKKFGNDVVKAAADRNHALIMGSA